MNSNKIVIYITIIACLLLIGCPTLYKVINQNHERLYEVNHKLIIEAAKKCFYDNKCENNKITLKELYEKDYLEKGIIDPVTKIVYNENSYVLITKNDSSFFAE